MKRIVTLFASLIATTCIFAQTSENFNSRADATLSQLKGYLQNHCWQFNDFDINAGGWTPAIEGDGAMVSGTAATASTTGIYSPALSVAGNVGVFFKYKFSSAVTNRRWLNIYLTNETNTVAMLLDNMELTGSDNSTVYTYSKTFNSLGSGCYKIFINYQGIDGDTRIAIDQLNYTAPLCHTTCGNVAPVAVNDFVAGAANHTASGNVVLPNDFDPDHSGILTAQLVTNSADGNVVLTDFGQFTFTPNPGFTGPKTTFTYIVCDNGVPPLCSDPATVTITFPVDPAQGSLPVTITDFGAVYANDRVNIKWTTASELNNDHYNVERSTDGISFTSVGTVKGQGTTSAKHDYQFNDDVSRNVFTKNDLYYRLKQVDADGNFSYSKVLVVRVYRSKSLQSLSVTPNPAINDIKVNVQLNENSYIVMKVANSSGIEVFRKTARGITGTNSLNLEGTSNLQAGVYFLEVIVNSNERMMVKLIKN